MLVYNYLGLSAIDMERRIVLITKRAYSTAVNGIHHIESESIEGLGLVMIYFHPFALAAADGGESLSCSEIANRTLITKGGVTGILDRLEARGVIKLIQSRDDRAA